jgi:hypothetical protein
MTGCLASNELQCIWKEGIRGRAYYSDIKVGETEEKCKENQGSPSPGRDLNADLSNTSHCPLGSDGAKTKYRSSL